MDQAGTTRALTTLSPILPQRTRELTNRLRVVRYTPGISRPLLQLALIHYARLMILDWLPPSEGNGGWRGLRWKYLLFESNYDGTHADYVRTFAEVLPARILAMWSACFGFDTTVRAKGIPLASSGFQRFLELNQLEVLEFYAAYPYATTLDVRQAILLQAILAEASREAGGHDLARELTGETATAALGPTSPPLTIRQRFSAVYDPWRRSLSGRYGVNPLTIITPLPHGLDETLREACADRRLLEGLSETQTHFARLVILPRHLTDLGQPDADMLDTPYLLFSSDAWGTAYDQIEAIRTKLGDSCDLIWGRCYGYPEDRGRNPEAFHAWVSSHMLPVRYYVAGYPPYPVNEIKRFVQERDRVAKTYARESYPSLVELLAEGGDDRG
ncbi:MAG TPA: hypothetical protein VME22_26245 [Solirubrobacteraceae bacterium]|nr:hypothetical protein [Solirubrobacteraceae bacterium]